MCRSLCWHGIGRSGAASPTHQPLFSLASTFPPRQSWSPACASASMPQSYPLAKRSILRPAVAVTRIELMVTLVKVTTGDVILMAEDVILMAEKVILIGEDVIRMFYIVIMMVRDVIRMMTGV